MRKTTLIVGPDGRVEIPGTEVGQEVTIHVDPDSVERPSLSPKEQEDLVQKLLEVGRSVRAQANPEWLNLDHGEWLYGPDGLPR